MQRCPLKASPYDTEMPSDISAQIEEENAMLVEYERLKKLDYKGFDISYYPIFTPIVFILVFGYFAWIQQSPIPKGCVLYLAVMCVAFTICSFFIVALSSQAVSVPLSYETKEALDRIQKSREKQRKEIHTSSNASSELVHPSAKRT